MTDEGKPWRLEPGGEPWQRPLEEDPGGQPWRIALEARVQACPSEYLFNFPPSVNWQPLMLALGIHSSPAVIPESPEDARVMVD